MFIQNRTSLTATTLFILLTVSSAINAQGFVRSLDWIPVSDGSGDLSNVFSGGINNLEFQFEDIDNDSDFDIIFLDSDKTFGWYENTGTNSTAEFRLSFDTLPGMILSDWFYLVDIDNDNDADIFTGNVDRVSFLENTGNPGNAIFTLMMDTVFTDEGLPIFSEAGSNPVFADIDADGDYDFFTGNSSGTVNYYENVGSPKSFLLKFITNKWQGLSIVGGVSTDQLHGASSLEFIDIDDDNDLDLFWGDFFSNSLYFLENIGDAENPDISLVSNVYPVSSDSVNTSGFNMPRFADIDDDGDFDLFVSVLYDPTVPQSILFYLNQGNSQTPDYQKVTDNYIKTLDVISNSQPAFIDIDDDGDYDLLIGSQKNPQGSLHLLKNIGSPSSPQFEYLDSIYFNITGDLTIAPTLGDLDGDNDFDLLVGFFNGTIAHYVNNGTAQTPDFVFDSILKDQSGTEIDVGITASPFMFDIDYDGDLDLSIGGFNGEIMYYKNIGSQTQFSFFLVDSFFSEIDVGDNSSPYLIDYDGNGTTDLFTGNRTGNFYYFSNNGTNENPEWLELSNMFIQNNFGNITVPRFIDIDNDTDMDLFLGNVKGGLYLYENTDITNVLDSDSRIVERFNLSAFPNPFNPGVHINILIQKKELIEISIYNILGERVKYLFMGELNLGLQNFYWDATNDSGLLLHSGNYFVSVRSENKLESIKLTFLK